VRPERALRVLAQRAHALGGVALGLGVHLPEVEPTRQREQAERDGQRRREKQPVGNNHVVAPMLPARPARA
jgi:hypothetical protein